MSFSNCQFATCILNAFVIAYSTWEKYLKMLDN